jgi:hypothetical protein
MENVEKKCLWEILVPTIRNDGRPIRVANAFIDENLSPEEAIKATSKYDRFTNDEVEVVAIPFKSRFYDRYLKYLESLYDPS